MPTFGEKREFRRAVGDRAYIYGVCAGFAYYAGLPTIMIRMICALIAIGAFPYSIFVYIGLWLTIPKWEIEPDDFARITHEQD